MEIGKLVKMANQIALFFEAEPDVNVARQGVANHIKRTWEPRMREALLQHIEEKGGEGLRPLVIEAFRHHKELLRPRSRS
ncbi:formate dehydrogenase subunit delta [Candidatus Methylacidithermus pantelleriae]|uniref:NAD-dependent formate dehydrogenase delta subunit n=1 Tax=Candidatus Methylacidithermus pantelleriae TaxID=2744239 RepID=A0A8J2FSN1_9BACT|nr:formate dehydrogenase subunit delta [Candidatus Methylacidithermus pantelleriae]CAF0699905.1 NAD-dependent formate dehydrogenase delta subunit [Candidatus Methylacidithermus pantelleriae]